MRAVLKLVLVGLALLSLLSWLGEFIEPLDVLSHLRLHFAAAALALMLAHVAVRQRWESLLAALLVAANLAGSLIYPYRPVSAAPVAAGERVFTIVTFNTRWAADNAGRVADFLIEAKPDVAVLGELTPEKRAIILPRLASQLPWQVECSDDLFCRLGVLSRHPWRAAKAERQGPAGAAVAWVDFGPEFSDLRLLGLHLTRPWPWWRAHRQQIAALMPLTRGTDGPLILAGDFNATPWSRTMRAIGTASGALPAGWLHPTWPLRLSRLYELPLVPQWQLDHVLLTPRMRLLSIETGPDLGSDHLPVIAKVVLPAR